MKFKDRADAGLQLARMLMAFRDDPDAVVLGIPRGGVPVAYQVATSLHLPLDIFLSRKLGVPGHEELAFGAVAAGDGRYLDFSVIRAASITEDQVEEISGRVRKTIDQQASRYRAANKAIPLKGKTIILVDDGIATGSSMFAAVRALRGMGVGQLVVGVPVAPRVTCAWLEDEVDKLVVVQEPVDFYAVGQFYEDFSPTDDSEVISLLDRNRAQNHSQMPGSTTSAQSTSQEISIPLNGSSLLGTWTRSKNDQGIVIFAHGSGSGRHSLRNKMVARILQGYGFSTLLFDLLTPEEQALDRTSRRFRFDIGLLTQRLIAATGWVETHRDDAISLPIFYFGASTGAAAALSAAAYFGARIRAVVSRGGRVDLAREDLRRVHTPTLMIVGSLDQPLLALSHQALHELAAKRKKLVTIAGATHLFEEEGALEEVAALAANWFVDNL